MKTSLFFITALICISFHAIQAQIINVPSDQPSIQAGINAAAGGDTVLVADNTYYENINFLGKDITVASHFIMDGDTNHINNTVINGSQASNPDIASVVTFNSGEDTTSILCGFTITGGTGTLVDLGPARIGGGIFCEGSGPRISHNRILNNQVTHSDKAGGGGIGSLIGEGDKWIIIEYNTIAGNTANTTGFSGFGGGVYSCNSAIIRNNVIEDNHCDNPESTGSVGGGVSLEMLPNSDTITGKVYDNIIRHNSVDGGYSNGGGLDLYKVSGDITGNDISYNSVTGLYDATGGGINTYYTLKAVQIKENVINANWVHGDADANGAGICSVFAYEDYLFENNQVKNNTLAANNGYWGVGMTCNNAKCNVTIRNNEFTGNSGPIFVNLGEVIPYGVGGGICVLDPNLNEVLISGNIFRSNQAKHGGGFYSRRCYNLRVCSNLFAENETAFGGGLGIFLPEMDKSPGSFPIPSDTVRPRFSNNTFVGNTVINIPGYSNSGGALRIWSELNSPAIIYNCIFWDNTAQYGNDIYCNSSDTLFVGYCDIYEGYINANWKGEGNIHADPGFDENDSLYHISESSPCFNTGADSVEVDGIVCCCFPLDYENDPRPYSLSADMGADECDIISYVKPALPAKSDDGLTLYQNSPNPASNWTDIGFLTGSAGKVTLKIYNGEGSLMATLLDEYKTPGEYLVRFNASPLPPGVYFYRLTLENTGKEVTRKMVKF